MDDREHNDPIHLLVYRINNDVRCFDKLSRSFYESRPSNMGKPGNPEPIDTCLNAPDHFGGSPHTILSRATVR